VLTIRDVHRLVFQICVVQVWMVFVIHVVLVVANQIILSCALILVIGHFQQVLKTFIIVVEMLIILHHLLHHLHHYPFRLLCFHRIHICHLYRLFHLHIFHPLLLYILLLLIHFHLFPIYLQQLLFQNIFTCFQLLPIH